VLGGVPVALATNVALNVPAADQSGLGSASWQSVSLGAASGQTLRFIVVALPPQGIDANLGDNINTATVTIP
jgi:hypothetical protein